MEIPVLKTLAVGKFELLIGKEKHASVAKNTAPVLFAQHSENFQVHTGHCEELLSLADNLLHVLHLCLSAGVRVVCGVLDGFDVLGV